MAIVASQYAAQQSPRASVDMAKTITSRITLNLVAGIVITVVTVMLAILWMAAQQNNQAARSTNTMVVGGVEAMASSVELLAHDYGWWEDAYNAYQEKNADWMWSNVGSSVKDTEIADFMGIISPEGEVAYGWVLEDGIAATDILKPAVISGIRALVKDMPVENLAARTTYVDAGDMVLLIAVSRLTPVSRAAEMDPATLPIYTVGFALSKERLGDLGKTFLIDDLRFERTAGADDHRFASYPAVTDVFGKTIGRYVWTPPTPGFAVLRNVLVRRPHRPGPVLRRRHGDRAAGAQARRSP